MKCDMAWEQKRSTPNSNRKGELKREIRRFLEVMPKLTLEGRVKISQVFQLPIAM